MRNGIWIRCGLAVLICVGVRAAYAGSDDPAPSGLAIAAVGEMPETHLERVRAFVERNTSMKTRVLEPSDESAGSLHDLMDALASRRTPEHAALVFLYAGDDDFEEHYVYRYEDGIGIVNAALMRLDDEERYLRRLDKLTMRTIGLLFAVEKVPNPQSAMWTYNTMAELDAMGRNFDPPSLLRLQQRARERDIPLIEESPYMMLDRRELRRQH